MNRLGKALVTETELVPVDETIRRLEAVTVDDVARLAAELYSAGAALGRGNRPGRSSLRARRRTRPPPPAVIGSPRVAAPSA